MSRLRCLQDFIVAQVDAMAECNGCRRRVRANPASLHAALKVKWRRSLDFEGSKLRCTECGHRGARIAPIPKIECTIDWEALQRDIEAMWERVMADEANEAPFKIEGPDSEGLVWMCSPEGRHVWCQNLGTEEQATAVMSQWLGSIDYQDPDGSTADWPARERLTPSREIPPGPPTFSLEPVPDEQWTFQPVIGGWLGRER